MVSLYFSLTMFSHDFKCFVYFNLFNSHNNIIKGPIVTAYDNRIEAQSLSNFPIVTQHLNQGILPLELAL